MPEMKNCPECGRLFAADAERKVCRNCMEKEDSDYAIVRRYVRDNPGVGVFEVAEATGISEEKILQFLKDGRLQSAGYVEINHCERCGKRISEGKYCNTCLSQINQALRSVIPAETQAKPDRSPRGEKMFVKDSEKKA